jgi:hypothetical protein
MQQILQIDPPSHSADCCLFLVSFGSAMNNNSFDIVRMFLCGWLLCFGASSAMVCFEQAPHFRAILLCLVSLPSPQAVDCYTPLSINGRSIANWIDRLRSGANCYIGPSSRAHRAEEQLKCAIAPFLCCRGGCFISPTAKLTASMASEARGGIIDGVRWLQAWDRVELPSLSLPFWFFKKLDEFECGNYNFCKVWVGNSANLRVWVGNSRQSKS